MRLLVASMSVLLLLVAASAAAQEGRTFTYSSSVEPDTFVFDREFQKDENGERIRDENGSFVPVRQYVTLTVEASVPCAIPPDGEKVHFFAEGPRWTQTENGESRRLLALEPDSLEVAWSQGSATEWKAQGTYQIEVISEAIPQETIDTEYTWYVETAGFATACQPDAQDFDVEPHRVVIPGYDFEPTDHNLTEDDLPGNDDRGIPAPGTLAALASIGLAVAARRRQ